MSFYYCVINGFLLYIKITLWFSFWSSVSIWLWLHDNQYVFNLSIYAIVVFLSNLICISQEFISPVNPVTILHWLNMASFVKIKIYKTLIQIWIWHLPYKRAYLNLNKSIIINYQSVDTFTAPVFYGGIYFQLKETQGNKKRQKHNWPQLHSLK